MQQLMQGYGLWDPIRDRSTRGELALFGTCAGAILLAQCDQDPPTFGLLGAQVRRNAYGRQAHSGVRPIRWECEERSGAGHFIRAPRFLRIEPGVRVLARSEEDPVALEAPGLLAVTFHPELGDDPWWHARFLGLPPRAPRAHAGQCGSPPSGGGDCMPSR